ncbi:MAG: hypothetical protein SGI92_20085 [Bryobacteraceae bacterium]|nr:hypothetical protein [Bryobacteraceae bacterium]
MLPPTLISASVHARAYVLEEKTGSISLIKIVDTLWIEPDSDESEIRITVVVMLKFQPFEQSTHLIQLRGTYPSGETSDVGKPVTFDMGHESFANGQPRGYHASGGVPIPTSELGTYYFSVLLDGEAVARTPVTLIRRSTEGPAHSVSQAEL